MTTRRSDGPGSWVLLSYRMPREPSTRRIAVWRKLKRLGVAQISDGLVALPADARTREHFDWIAEEIRQGGGSAAVWTAAPTTSATERELAAGMATARVAEYEAIRTEARAAHTADQPTRASVLRRLRAELRRVVRRDYFPPPERDRARSAVERLGRSLDPADAGQVSSTELHVIEEPE